MAYNIPKMIASGESDTLEFKSSFGKDVIETVCAFANHRGGIVLIGVSGDGKISGVSCGEESLQTWVNEIKQNTSPSVIPSIEIVQQRGRSVVCLRVDEFPVKPVAFRDRYYKRVANSNHRMSLTDIANMHMQSLQISWDSYPEDQAAVKDLSSRKMKTFLKRVREGGRFSGVGDWRVVLEKLGYLKNGVPTHAAMILFGKNDPPYQLHIGRFKTPSTIIDDRMIRGTLFEAVEDAMKFILSHIKVAFEITGEIQRREIPEYPLAALRELLLNSVVHRDYTSPTDIQIKIFDNAITFFNPGRLYGGLTVEELKTDSYQSRTRNKLIAEAFYLTHDIEKYGSGYLRIRKEIAEYATMSFTYEESGDGFLVRLAYQRQKMSSLPAPLNVSDRRSSEGINEGSSEGINEGSSEGKNLLLECIRKAPGQRLPPLAAKLKIPAKTMERWLAELKGQGRIEYRGSKKTGGYFPVG